MNNTGKTIVVFRKYKEGDILALFPCEYANYAKTECLSYQHVGQHGNADYSHCISITKPAKPTEYLALANELRGIGYDDLAVRKRKPANA